MAKFKSFSCPPNFVLSGRAPNLVCKCSKRKACGKQMTAPTIAPEVPGYGGYVDKSRGPYLIREASITAFPGLSGLSASKHQKGSRPVRAGTAPKTPRAPRPAGQNQPKRPHKVKALGGLDDLADVGYSLGADIPAAITSAGGAAASILNAIKGTPPAAQPPKPTQTHSAGMPDWVIPAAIAGAVILGGATIFAATRKKR